MRPDERARTPMNENIIHFNKKRNYQRITKDKVVTLKCLLRDADSGEALLYRDDMVYLHGGYGSALPKVEQALDGLEVDMITELTLEPADAYGEIDPRLRMTVPTEAIPEQARHTGAVLEGEDEHGDSRDFRVVELGDDGIVVDGNLPLAGRRLTFRLEVLEIRDATPQEIAAGYGFSEAPTQ